MSLDKNNLQIIVYSRRQRHGRIHLRYKYKQTVVSKVVVSTSYDNIIKSLAEQNKKQKLYNKSVCIFQMIFRSFEKMNHLERNLHKFVFYVESDF